MSEGHDIYYDAERSERLFDQPWFNCAKCGKEVRESEWASLCQDCGEAEEESERQQLMSENAERFYFLDSHGNEPFIRESDHQRIVKQLKSKIQSALDDAVMRVGTSANCYDSPADADSGAKYVAMRVKAELDPASTTKAEGSKTTTNRVG